MVSFCYRRLSKFETLKHGFISHASVIVRCLKLEITNFIPIMSLWFLALTINETSCYYKEDGGYKDIISIGNGDQLKDHNTKHVLRISQFVPILRIIPIIITYHHPLKYSAPLSNFLMLCHTYGDYIYWIQTLKIISFQVLGLIYATII